jgi:hypothetical protein
MIMDLTVCFIDDSDFEHELVRQEIAPCDPHLRFVQAYTFEEARVALGDTIPVLFLLDLWGQDPDVKIPYLTPKADLEKAISTFTTLDDVYADLDRSPGDVTNEYLKRLFSIIDSWRRLFETVCARIGQNRKYGLSNIQQARNTYPGVPCVFYTRKSLINDAVAIFAAGSDGLFIKPTGRRDAETRRLTKNFGPKLIDGLRSIIDKNIIQLRNHKDYYTKNRADIEAVIEAWSRYRNNQKTSPTKSSYQVEIILN